MTETKSTTDRGGQHPGLRPDSRLTLELIQGYVESGQWVDRTLRDLLSTAASEHPDRLAGVDVVLGTTSRRRMTYLELDARVHQLACGLAELGIRPGDSVVVMLPNRRRSFSTGVLPPMISRRSVDWSTTSRPGATPWRRRVSLTP